ncbi:hypothetical protein GGI12_005416, partial [Dipsacomyces acuminosporus]
MTNNENAIDMGSEAAGGHLSAPGPHECNECNVRFATKHELQLHHRKDHQMVKAVTLWNKQFVFKRHAIGGKFDCFCLKKLQLFSLSTHPDTCNHCKLAAKELYADEDTIIVDQDAVISYQRILQQQQEQEQEQEQEREHEHEHEQDRDKDKEQEQNQEEQEQVHDHEQDQEQIHEQDQAHAFARSQADEEDVETSGITMLAAIKQEEGERILKAVATAEAANHQLSGSPNGPGAIIISDFDSDNISDDGDDDIFVVDGDSSQTGQYIFDDEDDAGLLRGMLRGMAKPAANADNAEGGDNGQSSEQINSIEADDDLAELSILGDEVFEGLDSIQDEMEAGIEEEYLEPPELFHSFLAIHEKYKLIICKACKIVLYPEHVEAHLRNNNNHASFKQLKDDRTKKALIYIRLKKDELKTRDQIDQFIDEAVMAQRNGPSMHQITYLEEPVLGFKCTHCGHACLSEKAIKQHVKSGACLVNNAAFVDHIPLQRLGCQLKLQKYLHIKTTSIASAKNTAALSNDDDPIIRDLLPSVLSFYDVDHEQSSSMDARNTSHWIRGI